MANPVKTLISLIEDNWIVNNSNGKKPAVRSIVDSKSIDFSENDTFILIHRPLPRSQKAAGAGTLAKHVFETVNIDVRVFGDEQEDHFMKVIDELDRILDSHMVCPSDDYCTLEPDSDRQDLSDKTRKLWRWLFPVKLIKYAKARDTA